MRMPSAGAELTALRQTSALTQLSLTAVDEGDLEQIAGLTWLRDLRVRVTPEVSVLSVLQLTGLTGLTYLALSQDQPGMHPVDLALQDRRYPLVNRVSVLQK